MPEPKVEVIVEAVDHASDTLNRIGRDLSTNLRRIQMGLLLVGGTISAFTGFAVKAATDQRIAIDRIRASLEMLGDSYEARRENIDDLIGKISDLTGFSKTELLNTFNSLINATGSLMTAGKALESAALLAKGAGLELEAAAAMVVKAISGDKGAIAALAVLGVVVSDPSNPFQVLTDINKRFKEQVEESVTGTDRFKSALQDFATSAGTPARDALDNILGGLTPVIEGFKWVTDNAPGLVLAIESLGVALAGLAIAVGAVRVGLLALTPFLVALGVLAAIAATAVGLAALLIIGAIASIVLIALVVWKHWNEIWGWIQDKFEAFVSWFSETWDHDFKRTLEEFRDIGRWFAELWAEIWHGASVAFTVAVNTFVAGLNALIRGINAVKNFIPILKGLPNLPLIPSLPMPLRPSLGNILEPGTSSGLLPGFVEGGGPHGDMPVPEYVPMSAGGQGPQITNNFNGPIYGLTDLDAHIVETVRKSIDGGGFYQTIPRVA